MAINPLGIIPKYESSNCTDNHTGLSTSSGCFGFIDSTWKSAASSIGIDTAKYPTAADAPTSVQFAVAAADINKNGLNDWTCKGCDAKFVAYVDSHGGASAFKTSGLSTNPADYTSLDTVDGRTAFFGEFGVNSSDTSSSNSSPASTGLGGDTLTIAGDGGTTIASSKGGVLDRPFTWAYDKLITNTQDIVSAEIQQTQTMVGTYITPLLILALIAVGLRVMYGGR